MKTDETESRLHNVQQSLLADMEAMQPALPDDGEATSEEQQRRTYRTGRANAQNWRLAIQQINDRGEAGAPLFLPLPMNDAR